MKSYQSGYNAKKFADDIAEKKRQLEKLANRNQSYCLHQRKDGTVAAVNVGNGKWKCGLCYKDLHPVKIAMTDLNKSYEVVDSAIDSIKQCIQVKDPNDLKIAARLVKIQKDLHYIPDLYQSLFYNNKKNKNRNNGGGGRTARFGN